MNHNSASIESRYLELGAFIRSRRERLTPVEVGLPNGQRRRTPGLRRDEVALLAGVGVTWYTWLEQGRKIHASAELLSSLADVLRLEPAERRHLFALGDRLAPDPTSNSPEQVETSLQRTLNSLERQPAYVIGRRWDILAWNRAATTVFGDYELLRGDERNLMHLVFANPRHRKLLLDWDELAPVALALFRADSVRHIGEPDFTRLITILSQASAEFKAWWPMHKIIALLSNIKRIQHPQQGRMVFEYINFAIADGSDRKLTIYTPLDEYGTAEKLEILLNENDKSIGVPTRPL